MKEDFTGMARRTIQEAEQSLKDADIPYHHTTTVQAVTVNNRTTSPVSNSAGRQMEATWKKIYPCKWCKSKEHTSSRCSLCPICSRCGRKGHRSEHCYQLEVKTKYGGTKRVDMHRQGNQIIHHLGSDPTKAQEFNRISEVTGEMGRQYQAQLDQQRRHRREKISPQRRTFNKVEPITSDSDDMKDDQDMTQEIKKIHVGQQPRRIMVKATIGEVPSLFQLDKGADVSVLSKTTLEKMPRKYRSLLQLIAEGLQIKSAEAGAKMEILGTIELPIVTHLGQIQEEFVAASKVEMDLLGMPWILNMRVSLTQVI